MASNEGKKRTNTMSAPKLEILPQPQRRLWSELKDTPPEFVLYGGTALALRLAHRTSEDFDFFSNRAFVADGLRQGISYLRGAEMRQFEQNTLTAIVDRNGPVKLSFFGNLKLNRVRDPDVMPENGIKVASLLDVAATKLATIQQRAFARDYDDILALIDSGMSLSEMLSAAEAVYGSTFNGALSLKALAFFADGDLPSLPSASQSRLRALAGHIDLLQIRPMQSRVGVTGDLGE